MRSIPDCIFKTMCFCLLFVFFSKHSQAQISNLYIEYSKNQGLSDNFINSIVEDSKGFIWITSNYGINRFDGKYFKTYLFSDYPVLKRNNFKCSAIDRNGNILFGSYDGVIVRYNIKTLEFEDVSIKKIYGTNYVSINGFYSCSHGNLYALTTSGIFKFDYKEDKFDNSEPLYSGTQHLRVHSLYIDNFNRYWMCTGMGLYVVDGAKIYNLQDIFEQVVISENVYLQNYNDSILFIGTASSGLWAINIANKSLNNTSIIKIKSPFDDVSSFYLDSSQRLYIGTLSAGMWYSENISDINNIEFKPKEENLKAITCIHIDHYKNIWLGTRGAGLLCYPAINYSKVIHSSTLGFPNTIVSSFEKDIYGNIWVGTDGNGIYILSPENNIISHLTAPNHLTSNGVLDIANGSNGQFWVGTWGGGITKIDVETKKSDFFATWNSDIPINNVKSVCYSKDKSVWVASHGEGLVNYNPDKNIWKKYSDISDTWINKVIEDSDNKIWLASIHNVWLITEDSVAKILSNTGNSPEHYPLFIHSIAVNNNDDVYAATNKGIYVIDGQDKKVSMPNYLPKGEYLSIKFDNKNRAWATSNIGIIDIDIDNKTYTLVSSDYEPYINYFTPRAIYVDSLYNIYLGTSDGFLFFNKDSVGEKSSIKTFDLADIYINSQKISRNSYLISENEKTLKLPYNQTNIRVDIDIVSNDNVVISYFLDGFDKSWNNIENDRKIIFNQLPPGKYTLNIIAHTINNERESKSVKLNLIILPPWWKTWWFYISSSLLIAVLIFVIIRIRLKKLNEYALKLEKKVSERTTDLIAANKTISERNKLLQVKQSMIEDKNLELIQTISTKDKLMSIIAHDLKSPMHSLTSLLGLLIQNHSKYDDSKKNKFIDAAHQSALVIQYELLKMLEWGNSQQKNISYKPQTISVVEIIQDTISFLKQIAKNKSIEIRFEIKNDYYVFADAQLLSIAIRNILNNSIKFTPRGGVIYVSCYSDNDLLKICIKDTGIGIPENRLHKILDNSEIQSIPGTENEKGSGLGLKLTLEFIKINNGDIKIESEPNNGTIVTLCLPLLNKQDIVQKECNENPSDIIKDDTLINYNLFDESTILIVDDNSSYREYLSEVLGDFLNIIEAENGENGLKLAIEYSPDIIISDIDMPQMDGISMCKAIQNRKETSHIPLILVTAKADKSYKEIGLSSGAIDILNKPFSKKELIQKLHNILLIRQRIQDNILTHRLSGNDVKNKINPFVDKLITIIENNYSDTQFNVEKLTELMAMSRSTLIRKCISLVNKKPSDLIIEYRLQTAKKMLDDDFDNVSEIAYQTGFSDPRYFSRRFKMQFGISPSEYKSNKPE